MLSKLPPIEGLPSPALAEKSSPLAAEARLVSVELSDVTGVNVREVWVNE